MNSWFKARLDDLAAGGLLRDPEDSVVHAQSSPAGGPWIDACSNDYLGLAARTVSRETVEGLVGARPGAGASRLVQGTFLEHETLEAELADWLRADSCLLTSSAFAANIGLIPALGELGGLVVSDALNHASLVDGCRLARAQVVVAPHLDLGAVVSALRARSASAPAWVVTEGLFSMDGDRPDLAALRLICDEYGAGLVVDEAHSLGVLGPGGAGAAAACGIKPDVTVAGLGKAVGSQGGLIAGSRELRVWLWNRARSFVFSSAGAPVLARLAVQQVLAARGADTERGRLRARSRELREALSASGFTLPASAEGPILPLVLGSNERALTAMARLRRRGILVQAIRPPTVPQGKARLRLTAHADWPEDAVPRIVAALEDACA